MSPIGIASTLFSLFQTDTSTHTKSNNASTPLPASTDFNSSLAVRLASMQAQSVNLLLNAATPSGKTDAGYDWLTSITKDLTTSSSSEMTFSGLSTSGRNLSLFDPESAYRMMTEINNRDSNYKAKFSELSEMKNAVVSMQQAGQQLADSISGTTDNATIRQQLQDFTRKYNDWIQRFESTVEPNGVLDGTQAAEISLYELEQSVENRFNGAAFGLHGLKDLGVSIDPSTHLISLDTAQLDATLTINREAALSTVKEFASKFIHAAELLTSTGNFIPNRLNNLDRAIDFIQDNKTSLQAEFGLCDPSNKLSSQVAKALAAYNRVFTT